jgi:hypothetical protein
MRHNSGAQCLGFPLLTTTSRSFDAEVNQILLCATVYVIRLRATNLKQTKMDSDEYFGTLGGSLMKDLLADLQVDDNDWSLEQLEKELAALDQEDATAPSLHQTAFPSFDAASLVVSYAQERSSASLYPASSTHAATPLGMGGVGIGDGIDAWSLSLQKFTALSLQEDFLAADTARKQNEIRTLPPPGLVALDDAEDYDIREKPSIAPPPGMRSASGGNQIVLSDLPPTSQESQVPQPPVPVPQTFPRTPQNSISVGVAPSEEPTVVRDAILAAMQPLEETNDANDDAPMFSSNLSSQFEATHPPQLPITSSMASASSTHVPINVPVGPAMYPPPPMPPPTTPMMLQHPQGVFQMAYPMSISPPGPGVPIPPTPTGVIVGAAWQAPRPFISSPQVLASSAKVFCNPFPMAPPIPASALETNYMTARDIAFVVHAILKPVLAEPMREDDYFIQHLQRQTGGTQPNPFTPKKLTDMNSEIMSRDVKSKEWASEKSTLGYVPKSNVARPRALIATPQPTPTEQDNEHQKQRAILWKARVYCDQAYQAYQKVVDIWRAASPGSGVPPQVQLHLAKLMKCMGIVLDNVKKEYTADIEALKLLSKLGKGRILISRVLEQALLPPNAVQALLPVLLNVVVPLPNTVTTSDAGQPVDDVTVNRLFHAMTGIILKLNVSGGTLVKCLEVVQSHGRASISSPLRMECVHALLQKGGTVIGQDPSDSVKSAWGIAERQFMSLLQGV